MTHSTAFGTFSFVQIQSEGFYLVLIYFLLSCLVAVSWKNSLFGREMEGGCVSRGGRRLGGWGLGEMEGKEIVVGMYSARKNKFYI